MCSSLPIDSLQSVAQEMGVDVRSKAFAREMDARDKLAPLRDEFAIPKAQDGNDAVYLCGNSLGLLPKRAQTLVAEEFQVWAESGVIGHHQHRHGRPWVTIDEQVVGKSATIVGAKPAEVAVMGTLTANLHFLMVSFYRPTAQRYKILLEKRAFPSDTYAVKSQIQFHGYDPTTAMVALEPREGEYTLRHEDILAAIEEHGDEIALVLFPGVQYYTGQLFDIQGITEAAHRKGCYAGFDLAHAAGNVPLRLHDWQVDFACWCSYKYLNSGPGSIAGIFVHEQHFDNPALPRLTGWWGHEKTTRFDMSDEFTPSPGAAVYQHSNPSVLNTVCLLGSLQVFERAGMEQLREKSLLLTGYLEFLLQDLVQKFNMKIITPRSPSERGCQLSILLDCDVDTVFPQMMAAGLICDERKPNCIRLGPTPLYNSFTDVHRAAEIICRVMTAASAKSA
ncbi:L-kynurenine hydrolase-like protein [Thamnocephalis sphaerospora]|uniref:Kynureninase n=1 Tax=Thamnocephalis sphaerospora TaxID=78915 RepID=A0A4P9XQZ4_9FUNG|nr:L-kynurenine hydrolase-like protein [Thamnocephalis sphaerospora]|eukprot:RKP08487.1 L-kynurenine hydrolase-like protein [Thamnocephalis sphaerospora]